MHRLFVGKCGAIKHYNQVITALTGVDPHVINFGVLLNAAVIFCHDPHKTSYFKCAGRISSTIKHRCDRVSRGFCSEGVLL